MFILVLDMMFPWIFRAYFATSYTICIWSQTVKTIQGIPSKLYLTLHESFLPFIRWCHLCLLQFLRIWQQLIGWHSGGEEAFRIWNFLISVNWIKLSLLCVLNHQQIYQHGRKQHCLMAICVNKYNFGLGPNHKSINWIWNFRWVQVWTGKTICFLEHQALNSFTSYSDHSFS